MNSRVMKKSGKRLLALLLSMLMIVSMLSVAMISASAAYGNINTVWFGFNHGNNTWTDYTTTISGSDYSKTFSNLTANTSYEFYLKVKHGDNSQAWYGNHDFGTISATESIKTTPGTTSAGSNFKFKTPADTSKTYDVTVTFKTNYSGSWGVGIRVSGTTGGDTPTVPTTPDPEGTVKIYFQNPNKWSNVYVYVYDEKVIPKVENGDWPGVKMTPSTAYPGYWEYTVPDNLKNSANTQVMFNNGSGSQIPGQSDPGYNLSKSTHSYKDDDWVAGPPSGGDTPTEPTEATRPERPSDPSTGGDNNKPLHYVRADLFNYYYDKGETHNSANGNNQNGSVTDTLNTAVSDYFRSNESKAKSQTIWGYTGGTAVAGGWEAYDGPTVTPAPASGRTRVYWNGDSNVIIHSWAYDGATGHGYVLHKISGSSYYYADMITADTNNIVFMKNSSGKTSDYTGSYPGNWDGDKLVQTNLSNTSKTLYNTAPSIPHTTRTQSYLTPLYFGTLWPDKNNTGDKSLLASHLYHKYTPANMADRKDGDVNTNTSMHAVAQGLVDNKLNDDGMLTQLGIVMPYFDSSFLAQTTSGTSQGKLGDSYKTWFPMNVSTMYDIKTFSYDSLTDKNRYLDTNDISKMKISSTAVNNMGDGKTGYFPFSASNSNRKFASGTMLDITFYMAEDGVIKGNGGTQDMKFSFSGDDDVWVFVDGYLVMDMGGAHCAAAGTVDFTTLSSTVKTSTTNTGDSILSGGTGTAGGYLATYQGSEVNNTSTANYSPYSTYNFPAELKERLKDYTNPHTLTFYYMERGFRDSNMKITYNMPETPQVTNVNIENHVDFSSINSALLEAAKKTAYEQHAFAYEVAGNRSNDKADSISYTNDESLIREFNANPENAAKYTLSLPGTYSDPFSANGTETSLASQTVRYRLSDDENGDGTYNSSGGANTYYNNYLPLMYNQRASYVFQFALNTNDNASNIKIGQQANLIAPNNESPVGYTGTSKSVSDFYDAKWKLTKNEDELVNSGNIPDGESGYVNDGSGNTFKNNETSAGTNTAIYTAEFDNTAKAYDISVTKKVESNSEIPDDQEFPFYIDFAGIFSGDDYSNSANTLNDDFKAYRISYTKSSAPDVTRYTRVNDGKASFNLKPGETATFTGIPAGTTYRIYEASELQCRVGNDTFIYNYKNAEFTNGNGTKGELKDGDITYKSVYGTTSSDVAVTFTNGAQKQAYNVAYAYHERNVRNGQPTYVDNSKYVLASEVIEIEEPENDNYAQILQNAPDVVNIVDNYFLTANNVETGDLSSVFSVLDDGTVYVSGGPNAYDGKPVDTSDKIVIDHDNKYIMVYLGNSSQRYTVTYITPDASGNDVTKNYTTKKYNDLVKSGDISAPKSVDGRGNFLYWAVEKYQDPVSNKTILNPISTQNDYRYRITDNMKIRAVYENDVDELNGTSSQFTIASNLVADDPDADSPAGYGAVTLNTVYDKYVDNENYSADNYVDKIRANITVGAVGAPDVDKKISEVGYIRIQNRVDGEYSINNYTTASKEDLENALYVYFKYNGAISISNSTIRACEVSGHLSPDIDDPYQETSVVNLTNKNRANFVFTMTNSEANANRYYTVYTYVVKTNSSGEKEYFISPTPSFISLKDPKFTGETSTEAPAAQYTINSSVAYAPGDEPNEWDTKECSIRTSASLVNNGERVKITAKVDSTASYPHEFNYKLDSIQIGSEVYTVADGDITEVFGSIYDRPSMNYVLNYYVNSNDAVNGKIDVVANFSKFTEPADKKVKVKVIGHGSVEFQYYYDNKLLTLTPDANGVITIPAAVSSCFLNFKPEEGWELSQVDDINSAIRESSGGYLVNEAALSSPITAINLRVVFNKIS